jgi:hypothetical protein
MLDEVARQTAQHVGKLGFVRLKGEAASPRVTFGSASHARERGWSGVVCIHG